MSLGLDSISCVVPMVSTHEPKVIAKLNDANDETKEIAGIEQKNGSIKYNLERDMGLNYDCDENTRQEEESSIIDVDNDQMFDDTVFTEYDDLSLSRMTQKMSKHWRNKFKNEDKMAKKHIDNVSLEELVQRQTDKPETEKLSFSLEGSNCNESSKHITDNRRRRIKLGNVPRSDIRLDNSDIGKGICINFIRDKF